ncbi:hypothetical protein ACLKA7_003973 [Drosophila subpalustris]
MTATDAQPKSEAQANGCEAQPASLLQNWSISCALCLSLPSCAVAVAVAVAASNRPAEISWVVSASLEHLVVRVLFL